MSDQINENQTGDTLLILEDMNKEQLLAHAKSVGVDVKSSMNKPEIIQAIEAHKEGNQSGAAPDDPPPASAAPNLPAENNIGTDRVRIGTIRIEGGIEQVKVGPGIWVPTIREEIASDEPVTLYSKARAGKTVFGMTGKPIIFDEAGKAVVSAIDGRYLKDLPNYSLVED